MKKIEQQIERQIRRLDAKPAYRPMKAYQSTRMVETPFWACHDAEHAHATEPLANACIRESEQAAEFVFEELADEVVPVKPAKSKRSRRGV